MFSSWILQKVWRVFLQWFHPGFQKRFGEYFCNGFFLDFKKGLESPDSAELWRPPPNSWSCSIPPPPRQLWMMMMRMMMVIIIIIIIMVIVIVILFLLGRCWHHPSIFWVAHHSLVTRWEHVDFDFCCSSKNRFWKSGLLWLADWEWMGDGAKHVVQQNLSFQSYSWWEPSSFFSTSSFPKSSLGDDRLLLMGGRASPNTSEILQVRTLSLCYIDPVFWIARISKIGEEAQESFNLSPGRNSHCSIKVRVLIM